MARTPQSVDRTFLKKEADKYVAKFVDCWKVTNSELGLRAAFQDLLHHPPYRELYQENLKRALSHIPLVLCEAAFAACVSVGKQLMKLHLQYE